MGKIKNLKRLKKRKRSLKIKDLAGKTHLPLDLHLQALISMKKKLEKDFRTSHIKFLTYLELILAKMRPLWEAHLLYLILHSNDLLIFIYFDSSILAEEEFNDSFGEIVISNDPSSFTQLSYSYSISEDEAENVGYQMEHYDNNFNAEVKDVQLCTFLTSLSLFFKGFLSKKENFVTKESTEFKELSLKAEQSYPYVGDSNKVKQATTSRSKSKRSKNRRNVGGSNMVHPLRNDCPFRQSVLIKKYLH